MSKDINKKAFSEETTLKLDIFAQCFREWFPVFLYGAGIREIHIYDFFAGSGKDTDGRPGSPLVLLEEARGKDNVHCRQSKEQNRPIVFHFNEKIAKKKDELEKNVSHFISDCFMKNCPNRSCALSYNNPTQMDFQEAFDDQDFQSILADAFFGKFILLDQYGFKGVGENVFQRLIAAPKADFVFFISSSAIRRFKEHPSTIKHFDTQKISFDEARPMDCHRQIADYFQSLIPRGHEYYLHNFTIKKGANYWGLIFGSSHTLGMEKFLKVCWEKDDNSGESNCNIDNDWKSDELFHTPGVSNKKQQIKEDVRRDILSGRITDNITGFKCVLRKRGMPVLFTEIVKELEKEGQITRTGDLNYQSTNIHKVNRHEIHLLPKGGKT